MTLRQKRSNFSWGVGELLTKAYRMGYEVTIGDVQAKPCPKCGAYGHSRVSKHKDGLAMDLNLFKNGTYLKKTSDHKKLGEFWESLGPEFTWGGRFGDGNHYSYGEK